MRLLLTIGYTKLLLPADANTDAILRALAGAVIVEEKPTDYSEPNKYAVDRESSAGPEAPEFIQDSQIINEDEAVAMDIGELKKVNSRLYRERDEVKSKLEELEKKVATLTGKDDAPA